MKKKTDDFLMANIQVVYQQKKLLSRQDFDELLLLEDWPDTRTYLLKYDYKLPEIATIVAIDHWYAQEIQRLRKTMFSLNLPDEYVGVLFAKQDVFENMSFTAFDLVDEALLKEYVRYIQQALHPIVTQYAKYCLDTFFISSYLRSNQLDKNYLAYTKGHLSPQDVSELNQMPLATGINWLKKSYYHPLFLTTNKISRFEKQMADFITSSLKTYRYQTIGLEGIFTYCVEKKTELFNLRLLLKAQCYGLTKQDISERMRKVNV